MFPEKPEIVFPCDFHLKIIGINREDFVDEIAAIIQAFFPEVRKESFSLKKSKENNYISITVLLHVPSKDSLETLYGELKKHPDIQMVL